MKTIHEIRLANARELCGSEQGDQTRLAMRLGMKKQLLNHYIGKSPIKGIGNAVARRFEQAFDKPTGWLDREHNELEAGREDEVSIDLVALDKSGSTTLVELKLPPPGMLMARASKDWLKSLCNTPNLEKLALMTYAGDGMSPTLSDGAILLVDRGVRHTSADAVYAFHSGEEVFVKRISRRLDGSLLLISDNSAYPQQIVDNPAESGMAIIGRVVAAFNAVRL
jgi:hypothetical protein